MTLSLPALSDQKTQAGHDEDPQRDVAFYKPLLDVPDEEDLRLHERLCDPDLVTRRLGELVPLLKFVGFRVEQMTAEKTVLTVPLLETAMNQNGTHQAAVFYLIADYTLGVGMFATLPGCYTVGVHDRCHALPVQFWLRSGTVEHRAPGTGTIRAEVSISPEKVAGMRSQLAAKGRCELRDTVRIYQGDQLVALTEHHMGLYADLPRVSATRVSTTQVQRLKTSALMIAGLRSDSISLALAGDQGIAVAQRMTRASPQLPTLIKARSMSVEEYLRGDGRLHAQVLVLGAGLDPKPLVFASEKQRWFLCDLRDMLSDRRARLTSLRWENPHCVDVPVDLRSHGWHAAIRNAGFDPGQSTLVILEGVSMYLSAADLRRTLESIRELCGHRASRLWLDHVTETLLGMQRPEVKSFLSSMARLGEPFLTGFSVPAEIFGDAAWHVAEHRSAAEILAIDEPVHHEYRFSLLRPID